jgi:SAM-dependent methyltransferase
MHISQISKAAWMLPDLLVVSPMAAQGSEFDFSYTWPWTHGHLVAAVLIALLAVLLRPRGPRWLFRALCFLAGWATAGFLIVQFAFAFNEPLRLPTTGFLTSDQGTVLDVGCGSGRATIMVGKARPSVRLVALDSFGAEYINGNSPSLLMQNVRLAGMEGRVEARTGDMRQIPAEAATFDGAVSTYAIDRLGRSERQQALSEVYRVLREGGEFLLAVINRDAWVFAAYGPLVLPASHRPDNWKAMLENVGFTVVATGTTPGSAHFLCRKPPSGLRVTPATR